MFKNLSDFAYQRNWKEALLFYVVWLLVIVITSGLVSGLTIGILGFLGFIFQPEESFQLGAKIGNFIAVIGCLLLSFTILKKKSLHTHIGYILIGLISGLLAVFIGGFGGLIPCTYLSMLPLKSNND
ncbi:hypothetical protein V6Z05_14825 [Leptospira venezuelensis]|uniref:hypothetical protein n=1 Tax=Leptospira venezuelensis TaxID=1958811 RepID=UPI0018F8A99A|nr:hypothetical protein [Leptospira venezuelensis]